MRASRFFTLFGDSPSWMLPGASLDLDFANGRYYQQGQGSNLLSLINVTRASTAYARDIAGNLISFGNGVARITNKGLLVESVGTNIQIQSQLATGWLGNVTQTQAAATAPDGTLTAVSLAAVASNTLQNASSAGTQTLSASTVYTFSVFLKAGASQYAGIELRVGTNWVGGVIVVSADLVAGTAAVTNGGTATVAVEPFANGWYRISVTATTASSGLSAQTNWITVQQSSNVDSYAGTGQQIYAWGAQMEANTFATSYIPTTTVSATRAFDNITVANVTGTGTGVSTFANGYSYYPSGLSTAFRFAFCYSDGSGANRIDLGINKTNDEALMQTEAASTNIYNPTLNSAIGPGTLKIAGAWQNGDVNDAAAGTLAAGSSTTGFPSSFTTLNIGCQRSSSASSFNGYIYRVAVFPSRIPDSMLAAIST